MKTKKLQSILAIILILASLLLTGCMKENVSVEIYPGGNGIVKSSVDINKKNYDNLQVRFMDNQRVLDLIDQYKPENYEMKYPGNGETWYSVSDTLEFDSLAEFNDIFHGGNEYFDMLVSERNDGLILNMTISKSAFESGYVPNYTSMDLGFKNYKLTSSDLYDLKPRFSSSIDITMPMPVKMTKGNPEGIEIQGNMVHIDIEKVQESKDRSYEFFSSNDQFLILNDFSDMRPNHWVIQAMEAAYNNFFFHGYGDGTIRPDSELTVAQLCQVVYNVLKFNKLNYYTEENCAHEKWYDVAVKECKYRDLIPEYFTQDQNLEGKCSRQLALCVMGNLIEYCGNRGVYTNIKNANSGHKITDFSDSNIIDAKLYKGVEKAVKMGIAKGYGDGTLGVKDNLMRAHLAQILYNAGVTKL